MKIIFKYDQEKDIRCLLKYGKASGNYSTDTEVYKKLVNKYGENPTDLEIADFIKNYIILNKIDIQKWLENYQKDWDNISQKYQVIAEGIFNVQLEKDVNVYLTVNDRRPYSIENNLFYVSLPPYEKRMRKTVMHELWHFYTWYKFGIEWKEKLGKEKYNDLNEALTVLLNIECRDLLPEGVLDEGYTQHELLRDKILKTWSREKDIEKLWVNLV